MPIWLRRYTFHQIKEFFDKERDEYEKASGKSTLTANSNMNKFQNSGDKVNIPAYVSKVKSTKK
jgi:hypothetical protein